MDTIERIPLAAYESQCERLARIVRWTVAGWAITVLLMGMVISVMASEEQELVTETTSTITQDSDNNGSNLY